MVTPMDWGTSKLTMIDLYNLEIALLSLGVCFVLALFICRIKDFGFKARAAQRLGHIDGLRGYLALMVFIHHFVITDQFRTTGRWFRPPEDYFNNFGQAGVGLFFMITGFLFIHRVLAKNHRIDWRRLFTSRVFRIYPLYLFAFAVVAGVAAYHTQFQLREPVTQLVGDLLRWFVFLGGTINQYGATKLTLAWVDWTLRYEWLFYLSLPLLSFIISKSRWLTIGLILVVLYFAVAPTRFAFGIFDSRYLILFAVGGLTARLKLADVAWARILHHPAASLVAIAALLGEIFLFDKPFGPTQVVLLTIFFVPVALGNSLFGLLEHDASVFLGEVSYSIYLMHPIVLYTVFNMFGAQLPFTGTKYMLLMPMLGITVVLFSWATYTVVERPGMAYGKRLQARLQARAERRRAEAVVVPD